MLGAWLAELGADLERVNVNGGAIALGHPLGSTGARLMTTMIARARAPRRPTTACSAMCCGGGIGTATIIERID